MRDAQEVIELLSSSDESSSSDSELRRHALHRSSSSEEEKVQLKPAKRCLVHPPRRNKRAAPSENESESSQSNADSDDLEQRLAQLQRSKRSPAPKKAKVALPNRTRPDPRADGEMREITEGMNFYELQAQQQMMERIQAQNPPRAKGRKSAPPKRKVDSASEESEEKESSEEEWDTFTKKAAQREVLRRQKETATVGTKMGARPVEKSLRGSKPKTLDLRMNSDSHKLNKTKQAARKMATSRPHEQQRRPVLAVNSGTMMQEGQNVDFKARKTRPRSSSSGEDSEEESEQESEEDEAEVTERAAGAAPPSKTQRESLQTDVQATEPEKAQCDCCVQGNGLNANGTTTGSTAKTNGQAKTNGSGRRARMGVSSDHETPDTSSSSSYLVPPARNGFLASNASFVAVAGCTATPADKLSNPVIHSTAWRRLIFEDAPPNILEGVAAIPYAIGSDKPLWDYDKTGRLKEKCKFVDAVGQGVAMTEDNFEMLAPSQSEINHQVRDMANQELPLIQKCHARRVRRIVRDTRKQVSEYLQTHQVMRSERYRRLQWSEIANHQSWLDIAPIERATAKRVLQSRTHSVHPFSSVAGDVRYSVHQDQTPLPTLVCPETVTHLPNDITPIRRSFTMIGVRKNAFVEDDPILRYVPYLGDGERMVIDNNLYTETTMSKERRIAVLGEGEDLKVLNPGTRDDEVMACLLRVIVGTCGATEQVFLALQHGAGFDRPRIDYCEMKETYRAEQRTANRIAKVRELLANRQESSACRALRRLSRPCWFLQSKEVQPLSIRTFEGLVEWHRDLFCRRCFSYDCSEHGIQNPQRSIRADPVYPMVNAPCVTRNRQEVSVLDQDPDKSSTSSTSPENAQVIELTSSSSEDESKSQQPSVTPPEPSPTTGYRRSRRTQTRISSLATNSLVTQEKLLESERQTELEKRRKRREKLLSKSQACGLSCWIDTDAAEKFPPLKQVDAVLVRKLASSLGPNACVISAILESPSCTCAQISRFLIEEKRRRDSGDDFGAESDLSVPAGRQRKGRHHSSGVGSNRSLAKRVREQRSYDREKKLSYKPCNHDGVCDETCDCTKRGHSCNKACSCPRDCPKRSQGCKCALGNCHKSSCPCRIAGRECDPDYCFTCGASDAAVAAFHSEFKKWSSCNLNICQNVNMLRGSIQKNVGVAFSATHGWGAYALEPIRKDEFVLEYTGELISDEEAERRGAIYDRKCVSYLFGVNSEYVVDAARKGNKAKFANHKAKEEANLDVRIIASNGEDRIGLFANEAIEVGSELFFDYGYTHDSAPKWSQHDKPTQGEKRVYDVVDDENEWEQWE
ncbi:SET domain-containing protein [Phytophthora infestans]|uniref:SET domain-containing protein n=1 Tax=Phytophthora infestans TaxID=4787 RepID=A0A833S399_PHYIN|nr:SET domain-containing protein [Phytophthora infestans]